MMSLRLCRRTWLGAPAHQVRNVVEAEPFAKPHDVHHTIASQVGRFAAPGLRIAWNAVDPGPTARRRRAEIRCVFVYQDTHSLRV